MRDIIFLHTGEAFCDQNLVKIRSKYPLVKKISVKSLKIEDFIKKAKAAAFTKTFWIVNGSVEITEDLNYHISEWDEKYVHVFQYKKNGEAVRGNIYYLSKNYDKDIQIKNVNLTLGVENRIDDIFFIDHKTTYSDLNFKKLLEKYPFAQRVEKTEVLKLIEILKEKSLSNQFWIVDGSIQITEDLNYNIPFWDTQYVHSFRVMDKGEGKSGQIYLINKDYDVDIKIKNLEKVLGNINFFYDIFFIDRGDLTSKKNFQFLSQKYPDISRIKDGEISEVFETASQKSRTENFWIIDGTVEINEPLDYEVPFWDETYVHMFQYIKNKDIEHGKIYLANKEHDKNLQIKYIQKVLGTEKSYNDIFFIDYNNLWSDYNYSLIQQIYPYVKKINFGELGEICFEATGLSDTENFWIVDGSISILENFDIGFNIPFWDEKFIHVFQYSKDEEVEKGKIYLINKNYSTDLKLKYISSVLGKENKFNEIILLDSNDITSQENYKKMSIRFPYLKKVSKADIETVLEESSKLSSTDSFWVVDGNILLSENFDNTFNIPVWDEQYIHVFQYSKDEEIEKGKIYLTNKNYNKDLRFKYVDIVVGDENIIDEIFFIDYKNIWSDVNFENLIKIHPSAKKINVTDFESMLEAGSKQSTTDSFWIIDGKINLKTSLANKSTIPVWDEKYIHSFRFLDKNKINSSRGNIYHVNKNYDQSIRWKYIDEDLGIENTFYDIVFISYDEIGSNERFEKIKERFSWVKRVHGVLGIHNAHRKAAEISTTEMFWVVDADALIIDEFCFDYQVSVWDTETVHVWRSLNPVNGLTYGYGGVKLFPREAIISMDLQAVDMTTSISKKFKVIDEISNITDFNTDPYSTWKSAFRECAKLASKKITNQKEEETEERLRIWTTVGEDKPFGQYCIEGAKAGKEWGEKSRDDESHMRLINDFAWLRDKFDNYYKNK